MIRFNRTLTTKGRLGLSLLSAALLSAGWIGAGGIPLFVAFVPLLIISTKYSASARDFFRMLGWATLTFAVWNIATIWWVWIATPIGPIAATVVSTWWNLVAFMLFHFVSKRAPRGVAYLLFIMAWISTEYIYIQAPALSFPWLVLGNGFTDETWAVQWYEYTGVLGGSLWVLVVNILTLHSLLTLRKRIWVAATVALMAPLAFSVVLYNIYDPSTKRNSKKESVCIAAVQPNVDCYEKFNSDPIGQQNDLCEMLASIPDSVDIVLMPETSLAATLNTPYLSQSAAVERIRKTLRENNPNAMVVVGCETMRIYGTAKGTETARKDGRLYYDIFNSSIGIDTTATVQLHNKGKLVVGVETIPAWLREARIGSIDLGGTMGQLGIGKTTKPFVHNDVKISPAICYEGLYGGFLGGFVREGADVLGIVSNDGWWGNTLGHKFLFKFCRLRAIEHRRFVARSANTGISGFIDFRGEDMSSLGWGQKGVVTERVKIYQRETLYTRLGDYIGRMALYICGLCLLYLVAYLAKKKFYLN